MPGADIGWTLKRTVGPLDVEVYIRSIPGADPWEVARDAITVRDAMRAALEALTVPAKVSAHVPDASPVSEGGDTEFSLVERLGKLTVSIVVSFKAENRRLPAAEDLAALRVRIRSLSKVLEYLRPRFDRIPPPEDLHPALGSDD